MKITENVAALVRVCLTPKRHTIVCPSGHAADVLRSVLLELDSLPTNTLTDDVVFYIAAHNFMIWSLPNRNRNPNCIDTDLIRLE